MSRPPLAALALLALVAAAAPTATLARGRGAAPQAAELACDAAHPNACLAQARRDEGPTRKTANEKHTTTLAPGDTRARRPKAAADGQKVERPAARNSMQQNRP